MIRLLALYLFTFLPLASAATLTLSSQELFLYRDGSFLEFFNPASPEYFDLLDSDNFGSYGWTITNNSTDTYTNLHFIYFLDPEWDLFLNLASNEYAEFLGFGLPTGAPTGAIAFTSWEIDEPGYVFGDIYDNVSFFGQLDDFNAVPSSAPDDVSMAFLWVLPSLGPQETATLTIQHLTAATNGIAHYDPDSGSGAQLFVNGYLEYFPVSGPEVPEPSTFFTLAAGAAFLVLRSRK